MRASLEFHDSEIGSVSADGTSLVLRFSKAYVHRSQGEPGVASGEGYLQAAELVFSDATWSGQFPDNSDSIHDGSILIDGEALLLLPQPFECNSRAQAQFTFTSGRTLLVHANGVRCSLTGDAHWIESYEGN